MAMIDFALLAMVQIIGDLRMLIANNGDIRQDGGQFTTRVEATVAAGYPVAVDPLPVRTGWQS